MTASPTRLRLELLPDGEEGIPRERLVDDQPSHTHHRRAPVVALRVQLPGSPEDELVLANLLRRPVAEPHIVPVGVARPRDALRHHVARLLVGVLLEEVDLAERNENDDLEPRRRWQRRPRADGTTGEVRELDVLRGRQVPRKADAGVSREDTEEARHS